jgi:hypothetical protein
MEQFRSVLEFCCINLCSAGVIELLQTWSHALSYPLTGRKVKKVEDSLLRHSLLGTLINQSYRYKQIHILLNSL